MIARSGPRSAAFETGRSQHPLVTCQCGGMGMRVQAAYQRSRWFFLAAMIFGAMSLFLAVQVGAVAGYPGPIGRPGIPPGPPLGTLSPGGSTATTYICGFQAGTDITFKVNGTSVGLGAADNNGCVAFTVSVGDGPTITINTFSKSGPVSLGPVSAVYGDDIISASGLGGPGAGADRGKIIGLAETLVIQAPTPPPSTSTTIVPVTPTTGNGATTTTTGANGGTTTTSSAAPQTTTTQPGGGTTTTLTPVSPTKSPIPTKLKVTIGALGGAAAVAAAAGGRAAAAAAGESGAAGEAEAAAAAGARAGARAPGAAAAAGTRARGVRSNDSEDENTGTRTSGEDEEPTVGTRARGEPEEPTAGTRARGEQEEPTAGTRARGEEEEGEPRDGGNSFTDGDEPGGA